MKYHLFVGENCHDCKKVHQKIVEQGLDVEVKNLDHGDESPVDLFILPALLSSDGDLKAYGMDIIDYLQKPEAEAERLSWLTRWLRGGKRKA
ncbi:hypothetical protein KFE98_19820 [bacterium SCSIO 12741]|nr:hypothetical protein KFE98_19820 [bacterium SCSIO 12741]